jgi:DNA-binding ferritin-like protein
MKNFISKLMFWKSNDDEFLGGTTMGTLPEVMERILKEESGLVDSLTERVSNLEEQNTSIIQTILKLDSLEVTQRGNDRISKLESDLTATTKALLEVIGKLSDRVTEVEEQLLAARTVSDGLVEEHPYFSKEELDTIDKEAKLKVYDDKSKVSYITYIGDNMFKGDVGALDGGGGDELYNPHTQKTHKIISEVDIEFLGDEWLATMEVSDGHLIQIGHQLMIIPF